MKVIITKSYEEMSAKAAHFVLARLWRKPDSVLGLATGHTPIGLYENLATAFKQKQISFSQLTTFNLDEYWGLWPNNRHSYHYFMAKHLFSKIDINSKNTHLPSGIPGDAAVIVKDYEKTIKNSGGIDLQILGIGKNGHIGFNEPGTNFASRTHLAKLSNETRQINAKYFANKTVPTHALTMGLGTIMEADKILLLASGADKAKAIAAAIEGKVDVNVPASILQWHKDVTVIIDEAAAGELRYNYRSPWLFTEGDIELLGEADLARRKKILVISPHPDDACISLGGILSCLAKQNSVHITIMTTGYRSAVNGLNRNKVIAIREQEARHESRLLGAKPLFLRAKFYDARDPNKSLGQDVAKLAQFFKKVKPDIIFLPSKQDRHPTHRLSRAAALQALERHQKVNKAPVQLWEYEGPWSMFAEGDFNTIFSFDDLVMKKKMRAINSQKSQVSRTRFDVAAKSLAQLRAAVVPEQALVGYGAHSPRLGKYFELFAVSAN